MAHIERAIYSDDVWQPSEPEIRHVWVRGHGDYGPPRPGVIVAWQHAPVRNATAAAWNALVVMVPFAGGLLVEWVAGERIVAVRDAAPRNDAKASG